MAVNRPDPRDGLDVLAKVGGFEIGGIAGVILGRRRPAKAGRWSTASSPPPAALIAQSLCPRRPHNTLSPPIAAPSRAIGRCSNTWAKSRCLDLDLRLGEGTGAALAMHLVEAAQRILTEDGHLRRSPRLQGQPMKRLLGGHPIPHHRAPARHVGHGRGGPGRQRAVFPARRPAAGRGGRRAGLGSLPTSPRRWSPPPCWWSPCSELLRRPAHRRPLRHGRRLLELPRPGADAGNHEGQPRRADGADGRGLACSFEVRRLVVAGPASPLASLTGQPVAGRGC